MTIDIAFDFRTDADGERSRVAQPTLRHCHQLLWSRRLPRGASFDLLDTSRGVYLHEAFITIGYTIGGMMVFPGNRVDGKQTINRARGFNRTTSGRFEFPAHD